MPGTAGNGLVVGGLVGIVAMLIGWPTFDKTYPCGFLDVTCAFGRFTLFWVLTLLAVAAVGTGLAVIAFGAKRGTDIVAAGGAAGISLAGRSGARLARTGIGAARARRSARRR